VRSVWGGGADGEGARRGLYRAEGEGGRAR
jgi:hypothetical protein